MADVSLRESFFELILLIATLVTYILFALVWSYLSKKAIGMQTPFDTMLKDYMIVSAVSIIIGNTNDLGYGPYGIFPDFAVVISLLQIGIGHAYFLQSLAAVSTRYLLIFHSDWIDQINENLYTNGIRISIALLSVMLTTYEGVVNDFRMTEAYVYLTGIPNDDITELPLNTVKMTVLITVGAMTLMIIRIEVWKRKTALAKDLDLGLSYSTFRAIALVVLFVGFSLLLTLDDLSNARLQRIIFHAYFLVIIMNFLPILMILRNPNMKQHVKNVYNQQSWTPKFHSKIAPTR